MIFQYPSIIRSFAAALAVLALLAGGSRVAGVEQSIPGPVPARVLGIVDGDTVIVRARIWLGQEVETRAKLGDGPVVLTDVQYGKYAGRVVARIRAADGADLAQALIEAGLGRPYAGGHRESWCPG